MKNKIKSRIITCILSACMLIGEIGAPMATYAADNDDSNGTWVEEELDALPEEDNDTDVVEEADSTAFVPVQGIQMLPTTRYFQNDSSHDSVLDFISFKTYPVSYTWKELKAQGYTATFVSTNNKVAFGFGGEEMTITDSSLAPMVSGFPNINDEFKDGAVDRVYLWLLGSNLTPSTSFTVTVYLNAPGSSQSFNGSCNFIGTTDSDLLAHDVTGLSSTSDTYTVGIGQTKSIGFTVSPSSAENNGVNAYSTNPSIAVMSGKTSVKGIAAGTATFYAETDNWVEGDMLEALNDGTYKGVIPTLKVLVGNDSPFYLKGKSTTFTVNTGYVSQYEMRISGGPSTASMYEGVIFSAEYSISDRRGKDFSNVPFTYNIQDPTIMRIVDLGMYNVDTYPERRFQIEGLKAGTTTFTVSYTEDGHKYDIDKTITVTVKKKPVDVTGVAMSPKTATMAIGDTKTLTATVSPSDASIPTVRWTSSAPDVVSVSDDNGTTNTVTALKAGTATITVNVSGFSDTCVVTVNPDTVAVTGVTVAPTELSLKKGQTGTLTATVAPANATNKNVSYSSTKTSVATVSETGVVTAVAKGEATIIVTTEDGGKTAMCSVTVTEDAESVSVSSVSLDEKTASLKVNETKKLTATVLPENATNKNVTWSSSDAAVATVSADGTVTAVAAGTADITVTTVDGAKTDKCVVTVTEEEVPPVSVNGVSLNTNTASIKAGETTQLTAVVTPEEATNKNVVFSSDNTSVATVSDTGLVSGVKAGTANITVTTEDGGFTDTCTVTVTEDEPVNPEDPRPDPSDEPESDLGEDTYDDIIDYTEARAIYLVKGQKVRIPGSTVTTNDKKVVAVSKPKAGYTTLTAKKNGLTPVTITNVSGNTLTHTFYVENPAFAKKSYKLGVGESQAFGITLGANTDKYTVYYRSSNQDIAYVADGKLYAVSKGSATITAYINGRKFNCKVKVTDPASPKSVDGYETVKLVPNQQLNLKYNSGFKSKGATWTIVDGDPVKPVVSIKGSKVTAVSVGTAKLTGTDTNGTIKNLIIEVTEPDTQTLHLNIGSKKSVKFYKLNNKKATWTSSDNNIATVANGTIVGANPGTTTVTAVCNGVTYTTVVTVEEPVVVISENMTQSGKKYALNIMSGDTFQISLKNVSQAVAYTSDKPEIARVNNHGRIIASSAGKAKITAKINGVTITIIVNVFDRTTNAGIPAGYANSDASYEYDEAKDYSKEMGAL